MHEHIAPALYYLQVHLLYASLVCVAAWGLTSLLPGSATAKYWIWVATAVNFAVPLGGFFDEFGALHIAWASQLSLLGDLGVGISRNATVAAVLCVVWALGAILLITRLWLRIRVERGDAAGMTPQDPVEIGRSFLAQGVPVRFATPGQSPAVEGVLRPHISLPRGIERLLSEQELDAVLIHELTHAKRRDNLIRLVYEVGLCALWFHPLVWLTGSRLALYRELSCDESVIRSARGEQLVSALAKLASPQDASVLRATASSFISHRLARLTEAQPGRMYVAANILLTVVFAVVVLAGIFETIAHTPSCFRVRG